MADFDDEVLATVRALSATVGVPEHLPGAAAGRARRADILDRGFVPRVLTAFDAAKAIERAADAVTIASAKELNGMVAVAETTLRYWYDPVCHLLAQKAANNVSSLVLRAIPWSPAVHSLFPRGPRAIVRTVLLATARGAMAVPFDVVVSKILPFAITLQRHTSSRSYAALGGSDDDEEEDPDDDGSVANLTAVLSAAAVGGSDDDLDDGSLSSAADAAAA